MKVLCLQRSKSHSKLQGNKAAYCRDNSTVNKRLNRGWWGSISFESCKKWCWLLCLYLRYITEVTSNLGSWRSLATRGPWVEEEWRELGESGRSSPITISGPGSHHYFVCDVRRGHCSEGKWECRGCTKEKPWQLKWCGQAYGKALCGATWARAA